MTNAQLKAAQELSEDIKRLEALIGNSNACIYLLGPGEDKNSALRIDSYSETKTHALILDALNQRLEKFKSDFERM